MFKYHSLIFIISSQDPVIITAEQSFHGRTLATVTATAQPKYHKGFTYGGEMVRGFKYTPYNDLDALKKLVDEMNAMLDKQEQELD